MSSTFARRQAFSVERRRSVRVQVELTLVYAHAVEAAAFVEVEQVLGEHRSQTEKPLDATKFFHWVGDEVLGAEKVELVQREVAQPSRQMHVVHRTLDSQVRVVDVASGRVHG